MVIHELKVILLVYLYLIDIYYEKFKSFHLDLLQNYDFCFYSTRKDGLVVQEKPVEFNAASDFSIGMWIRFSKAQDSGLFFQLFEMR